ncbi:hypothetical protein Tco_0650616 [Tanacetum coccineum]
MDDLNITMKEYIRFEEEKARRQGRTFNWQTPRYGKIKYYENGDDSFTDLETEYPAIVFDDTSDAAFSREPTVSPLDNNEIDFNISFDESNDERLHDSGDRLSMVYAGDDAQALFTSHARRRLFEVKGPLVREFILEFLSTYRMSDTGMGLDVADTLCFQLGEARRRMTWR